MVPSPTKAYAASALPAFKTFKDRANSSLSSKLLDLNWHGAEAIHTGVAVFGDLIGHDVGGQHHDWRTLQGPLMLGHGRDQHSTGGEP